MTVTFESDWEVAREMVQGVIDRHAADPEEVGTLSGQGRTADRYFNLYQDLAPAVYVKAIDFGVTLTGRLLVRARGRRLVTSRIWQDLLRELGEEPGVALAYPTTRFFRADLEGSGPDV